MRLSRRQQPHHVVVQRHQEHRPDQRQPHVVDRRLHPRAHRRTLDLLHDEEEEDLSEISQLLAQSGQEDSFESGGRAGAKREEAKKLIKRPRTEDERRARFQLLDEAENRLKGNFGHFVDMRRQLLDDLEEQFRTRMRHEIELKRAVLRDLQGRLHTTVNQRLAERRHLLDVLRTQLESLDIREVLKRGYSVTEAGGKRVLDASQLEQGDEIVTHYHHGKTRSRVEKIEEHEREE